MRQAAEESSSLGDAAWWTHVAESERIRALAAELLSAGQSEVAFVPNTSSGLSYIAEGLDWRDGDNVVGAASEFAANVYPWSGLGHRGIEHRLVAERAGRLELGEILAAIDDRTRVVALSWVQYASGFRLALGPIGRFCRERGILFVVDAIQGLGALPLDVHRERIDVCVAGAHKWLLGPEGVALQFISDRVLERIRPVVRGWLSVEDPFGPVDPAVNFLAGANRFECGTRNVTGIYGLGASLEILSEVGSETVARRVLELAARMARGLEERGFTIVGGRRAGEESGIVTATHPEIEAELIAKGLAERDVRIAHRIGRIRISPHFYNTRQEIDLCLEEIDRILEKGSG
jgi:selenocysteine lyase/cysteine desulfurase